MRFVAAFSLLFLNSSSLFAVILDEQSVGEKVVDKALAIVASLSLAANLPDISDFLKRIAKVESHYGEDLNTFRRQYFGGIWQIDWIGFNETKNIKSHPKLTQIHKVLLNPLKLLDSNFKDWVSLEWERCRTPFYSCLSARLYLATIAAKVPRTLIRQAHYWKKYYNTEAGDGKEEQFIIANTSCVK